MGSIPFALSVHHFISSVGADAGFASIIGLAILALLYFAQARETARVREHAEDLTEQLARLENRIRQAPREQAPEPAPATRPAAAAAPTASRVASQGDAAAASAASPRGPAETVAPAPPAGVAAPALAAATRLIPAGASTLTTPPTTSNAPPSTPRPVTAAGAGNGMVPDRVRPVAANVQQRGAGSPVREPQRASQPSTRPPTRSTATSEAPRRPAGAARPAAPSGGDPSRRFLFLIGALAIAGIIAGVVVVSTGSGGTQASNASPATAASGAHSGAALPAPSSVTVAVLNGTATSGLAHRVATNLQAKGYKGGTIATASDQTRTATVVAYMPGHRRAALEVAAALKLGPASVQPVDSSTQSVACPPPSACSATVVVTVGSDLASS